ncbi:MAG: hypothetical protein LBS71_02710, partial [Puniceicoccales bacterium]|nr:hypothetical protein [Puniceicoccales bacterium]
SSNGIPLNIQSPRQNKAAGLGIPSPLQTITLERKVSGRIIKDLATKNYFPGQKEKITEVLVGGDPILFINTENNHCILYDGKGVFSVYDDSKLLIRGKPYTVLMDSKTFIQSLRYLQSLMQESLNLPANTFAAYPTPIEDGAKTQLAVIKIEAEERAKIEGTKWAEIMKGFKDIILEGIPKIWDLFMQLVKTKNEEEVSPEDTETTQNAKTPPAKKTRGKKK